MVDGLSVSCHRSWRPARQRRGHPFLTFPYQLEPLQHIVGAFDHLTDHIALVRDARGGRQPPPGGKRSAQRLLETKDTAKKGAMPPRATTARVRQNSGWRYRRRSGDPAPARPPAPAPISASASAVRRRVKVSSATFFYRA